MSKEDVINYVMTTPNNPNRAVLEGMLDEVSGTQLPSPTLSDNGKVLGVDGGEYKLVEQSSGEVEYIKIATATLYTGTIDSTTGLYASTGGAFDDNKTLGDAVSNKKIVGFHFVPTKDNVPTFGILSASNVSQELFDVIKNADEAYQLTGYNIGLCQPRKTWVANDTIDIYAICI